MKYFFIFLVLFAFTKCSEKPSETSQKVIDVKDTTGTTALIAADKGDSTSIIHEKNTPRKDTITTSRVDSLLKEQLFFPDSYDSILVQGMVLSSSMIAIEYEGLEGSNPRELGYFLAIWQGSQINDLSKALEVQNIATTTQDGSVTFKKLKIANLEYVVGLGVNNQNGTSICATISVPAGVKRFVPLPHASSTIKLLKKSTNTLAITYYTPKYNLPDSNKNWIALFKGGFTAKMFQGVNCITTTLVTDSTNIGTVALNNIPNALTVSQRYTVVYGMGVKTDQTLDFENIIAAVEFSIPDRESTD